MSHMQVGDWQPYDEAGRRKYVNGSERKRFLHAADQMGNDVRTLCHVLAYSGCRISEALNLTGDHIDQERGALVIRTLKRRRLRFRMVPVPYVDGSLLQGLNGKFDRIACFHMSGLSVRSHVTAGQDGFRGVCSQQGSGL